MHGIGARADDDFTMRTRRPRSSRLVQIARAARVAMRGPPRAGWGRARRAMCLSELENPGTAATVLGAFSVVFSTLVGIPQAYKIYRNRSARGISFLTLGLGNVGGFLHQLASPT